jgi:predicted Zn-dependent protease
MKIFISLLMVGFLASCSNIPVIGTNDADVYFVPIGPMSDEYLEELVEYYSDVFPMRFSSTPPLLLREDMLDIERGQLMTDRLMSYMTADFKDFSSNENAMYIGVTHLDMYIPIRTKYYAFSMREGSNAVISSARLYTEGFTMPGEINRVLPNTRILITRSLAFLFFKKGVSNDPTSVIYKNISTLSQLNKVNEDSMYIDVLGGQPYVGTWLRTYETGRIGKLNIYPNSTLGKGGARTRWKWEIRNGRFYQIYVDKGIEKITAIATLSGNKKKLRTERFADDHWYSEFTAEKLSEHPDYAFDLYELCRGSRDSQFFECRNIGRGDMCQATVPWAKTTSLSLDACKAQCGPLFPDATRDYCPEGYRETPWKTGND